MKQLLQPPVATFTYIKNGLQVTFNSTSTNATSIEWDFGDGTSSTINPSITHLYSGEGSYDVSLIASNICGIDTFNRVIVLANTGIDLNALIETLTLYPNPNNGVFTLGLEADFNLPHLDLVLYDILGNVVDQRTVQFNGKLTENYNLQELPPGTYLLHLNSEKGSVTLKVSLIK
ncbi:MAG: T9SS type A sorting domain-containing protein [Chitinophagales bacterium]